MADCFSPVLPRRPATPGRHRPGRAGVRVAAAGRQQLQGAVPVPQREDAVVQRQPRAGLLPLLRLRRRRQRLQVRRAARASRASPRRCGCWRRSSACACRRRGRAARPGGGRRARGAAEMHEVAAAFYRERAGGVRRRAGAAASCWSSAGCDPRPSSRLGSGFAPPGRDALLVAPAAARASRRRSRSRAGWSCEREGRLVDRFWNRLMIPICRESGSIVAFGGRAMEADQQPKYLNSPETPIYTKGRTLYGLNVTQGDDPAGRATRCWSRAISTSRRCCRRASRRWSPRCGTALTQPQVQLLRRFTSQGGPQLRPGRGRPGRGGAVVRRWCARAFRSTWRCCRRARIPSRLSAKQGGAAYQGSSTTARPYLDFLLDRAAAQHDLDDAGRPAGVPERDAGGGRAIPDAAARDQFADRLAHRAGITEEVVRDEIRKAAVARKPAPRRRRGRCREAAS